MNIFVKFTSFFVLAIAISGFNVSAGTAQTATNLKCKGCVGKKDIGKKAVKKRNIANKAVREKTIDDGAVTSGKIADGAITAGKISSGAVSPLHLSAPTGAAGIGDQDSAIGISNNQITATLSVTIPRAGVVVVDAVGAFRFGGANDSGTCGISAGITQDGDGVGASGSSAPQQNRSPFAVKRTFIETSAGTKNYRLVCSASPGNDVDVLSPAMSAIYAPVNIQASP